jgi:hypothetical protein
MARASDRIAERVSRLLFITEGPPSIRKGAINGLLVDAYVAALTILAVRITQWFFYS